MNQLLRTRHRNSSLAMRPSSVSVVSSSINSRSLGRQQHTASIRQTAAGRPAAKLPQQEQAHTGEECITTPGKLADFLLISVACGRRMVVPLHCQVLHRSPQRIRLSGLPSACTADRYTGNAADLGQRMADRVPTQRSQTVCHRLFCSSSEGLHRFIRSPMDCLRPYTTLRSFSTLALLNDLPGSDVS